VSNASHDLLPVRLPCTFTSGMHRMCQCRILLWFSLFVKFLQYGGRVAQVRSGPFLSLALDGTDRGEDTTVVIHRRSASGPPAAAPFPESPGSLGGGKKTQIAAPSATFGPKIGGRSVRREDYSSFGTRKGWAPPEKVRPCSRTHHQHTSHYWHSSSLIVRSAPRVACQKVKFVGVRKTHPQSTLALKMPIH
jgi:hypothetical protein